MKKTLSEKWKDFGAVCLNKKKELEYFEREDVKQALKEFLTKCECANLCLNPKLIGQISIIAKEIFGEDLLK